MKKRVSASLLMCAAVMLGGTNCSASIIPAQGMGQIGYSSVVLCNSISLHSEPAIDSATTQTLSYGDRINVTQQSDGWAKVVLGDAENSPSGWVNADFIAVDPAWYQTDAETLVYAWNDASAPKVALLDANMTLPILKDDGEWLVVSLRGAVGWIYQPNRTAAQSATAGNAATPGSSTAGNNTSSTAGGNWFTVYAKNGATASIHLTAGATYEDSQGRTYVKQGDDGYYYCVTTDTTYAFAPTAWTGEAYGENQYPSENTLTGADYGENQYGSGEDSGENQEWTGADYGENQYGSGEDYGENQEWTGADYGENQGWTGADFGENAAD